MLHSSKRPSTPSPSAVGVRLPCTGARSHAGTCRPLARTRPAPRPAVPVPTPPPTLPRVLPCLSYPHEHLRIHRCVRPPTRVHPCTEPPLRADIHRHTDLRPSTRSQCHHLPDVIRVLVHPPQHHASTTSTTPHPLTRSPDSSRPFTHPSADISPSTLGPPIPFTPILPRASEIHPPIYQSAHASTIGILVHLPSPVSSSTPPSILPSTPVHLTIYIHRLLPLSIYSSRFLPIHPLCRSAARLPSSPARLPSSRHPLQATHIASRAP